MKKPTFKVGFDFSINRMPGTDRSQGVHPLRRVVQRLLLLRLAVGLCAPPPERLGEGLHAKSYFLR